MAETTLVLLCDNVFLDIVMSQVETMENFEGIFPGDLIHRGKEKGLIHYITAMIVKIVWSQTSSL